MSDLNHGVAGAVGAAVVGAAVAVKEIVSRRKRQSDPVTPEGMERRLAEAEREIATLKAERAEDVIRLTKLEDRMQNHETTIAAAIGRLTEAVAGQSWNTKRLADSVDDLKGIVARVDVEATIERELRKHARKET